MLHECYEFWNHPQIDYFLYLSRSALHNTGRWIPLTKGQQFGDCFHDVILYVSIYKCKHIELLCAGGVLT